MSKKHTFIDLFAGCGGLTEGFMQTGKYEPLSHVEWDHKIALTLKNRLKNKWKINDKKLDNEVITFDLQKSKELLFGNWTKKSLNAYMNYNSDNVIKNGLNGVINKDVDIIIGGPPCQAYSIAGRAQDPNSMKDDYRNYLFESFVDIVNHFKPKFFLFENVPGILSACPGDIPVTKRIYNSFKKINYAIFEPSKLKDTILDSSDFGVPQKRRRVIILGVNKDFKHKKILNEIYEKLHQINTKKVKTTKDAISNFPPLYPIDKSMLKYFVKKQSYYSVSTINTPNNHIPRYHNQRDIGIFKEWVLNDMNKFSTHDKINFYTQRTNKSSKHNKYRNLEWNKPSPTIVSHLYKDGLMFIHPDPKQSRSITVREAAKLQSFDDDFMFTGTTGIDFKMIGNAVPPLMAKKIGNLLSDYI